MSTDSSKRNKCTCKRGFPTAAALKKHRNTCIAFKTMWIQPDTSATHELAQAAADNPPNLNASGPSETLPSPSEAPGSPGEAPTHGMTGSEPQEHGDQTQQPGTRIQREDPRPYSDQVPPALPIDEDLSAPVVQHGDNANARAQPESSNHKTSINQFGVYCVYPTGLPTYNPDINFHIGIVSDNRVLYTLP
ncbi:hypothetical protein BJ165DRAFT_1535008 [Panaeolus papilionaceus]|nr:hypothetical protein BJ165DRAFT_1535008 [Panaeolus papilionaceus]